MRQLFIVPAWSFQIAADILYLKHSIQTNDTTKFKELFEEQVFFFSNISFQQKLATINYQQINIQISSIKTLFFTNERTVANAEIKAELSDDGIDSLNRRKGKLELTNMSGYFVDPEDSTAVYAKADFGFNIKGEEVDKKVSPDEFTGNQTIYFRKNKDGNWKITNFFVNSSQDDRRIFYIIECL